MKRLVLAPLVFAAALVAGGANAQDSAQSYGYQDRYGDTYQDGYVTDDRYYDDVYDDRYGDDRYVDDRYGYADPVVPDRYGRTGTYDTARVLRVDPIVSRGAPVTRRECVGGYDDRYAYGGGYGSDPYRQRARTSGAGAVIGAVIGGALGNAIADDDRRGRHGYGYRTSSSQRTAATVLGAVVGGAIGNGIERSAATQRDRRYGDPRYGAQGYYGQPAADCRTVGGYDDAYDRYDGTDRGGRVDGYRVTYEYAGRRYETVTDYHPGDRLRVRVDVRPEG